MKEIPHLRTLVERHKNEPFALVGINTDSDRDMYKKRAAEMEVNWRSAWAGSPGGDIPTAWNIQYYPSTFVLDAQGTIRHRNLRGEKLDAAVAELLAELKAGEESGSGASPK